MCEVNTCCCLTLRQGCLLIGGVTMLVSLVQTLVFSWVLLETYQSSARASSSSNSSSSSNYYFSSATCPIGFFPVAAKAPAGGGGGLPPEYSKEVLGSPPSLLEEDDGDFPGESTPLNEEIANDTAVPSRATLHDDATTVNVSWNIPRINCAAPGQGVLWALVFASAIYSLVGGLLIAAVLRCVSWQLSIWFFYTVGYDLFTLIIALTDGVYISFSDVSSYVVCLVTTYCVIVVDSFYEKLLHDERLDKANVLRRRSSLVIVRSSPESPSSHNDAFIPPTTYVLPTDKNNLAPPPAGSRMASYTPAAPRPPAGDLPSSLHVYHNNV